MVPRGGAQGGPALAAKREQVIRGQLGQLSGTDRVAPADQEVAHVAPIVGDRRFGEPSIVAQELTVPLEQRVVDRPG